MTNLGNIITITGKRYEAMNFQLLVNENNKVNPTDPCVACSLDPLTCSNFGVECRSIEYVMYFKEKK